MRLDAGSRLGPYEILGLLGKGGMGEVYRARDTRLGRTVAIKILPAHLARDTQLQSRFEREAMTVASLAHPNICTLHDVGHHDDIAFLVMELLDGDTLDKRLRSGPLQVPEALQIAIQIAEALDAAHRKGIIHRDLKPANVMLTSSGVKLLDFGLAKLGQADVPVEMPVEESPTRTTPLTGHGEILGTLPYMAPEQLEGKLIDPRTDLFAFGTILREMLTGRRVFDGTSQAGIIGAILHTSPPALAAARSGIPPALDHLLSRCLWKDPQGRWSTAHDVLLSLRWIAGSLSAPETPVGAAAARRRPPGWSLALAAIGLVTLSAAIIATRGTGSPAPEPRRVVSVVLPAETALVSSEAPKISPDGRRLAFAATDATGRSMLYVRELDEPVSRPLPGTEGVTLPFWSPDSTRIGFFSEGLLKTIPAEGGSPLAIARTSTPRGGTWSRDDLILFIASPSTAPLMVPAAGGDVTAVPVPDGQRRRWFPGFLPDGRHYVYLSTAANSAGFAVKVGSIDSAETKLLFPASGSVVFAPPNQILFRRGAALFAQTFDPVSHEVSGTAVPVAATVGFNSVTFEGYFSASDNGVVALLDSASVARPIWFDRQGNQVGEAGPEGSYNTLCITPDQRRIVYDQVDPVTGNVDIWSRDLVAGTSTRQTFDPAVDFYPVCSPDGEKIVFSSLRNGVPTLYLQDLAAPGSEKSPLSSAMPAVATDWSRDSKRLVYSVLSDDKGWDIMLMPSGGGDSIPALATPAGERSARMSPDGRWLAYVSDESGRFEVYIQPLPATGAQWQVSNGGGLQPQWSGDGAEIYYVAPDRRLMAAQIKVAGSGLALGEPVSVLETRISGLQENPHGCQYAVGRDGKRFLVVTPTNDVTPITLILNWPAHPGR